MALGACLWCLPPCRCLLCGARDASLTAGGTRLASSFSFPELYQPVASGARSEPQGLQIYPSVSTQLCSPHCLPHIFVHHMLRFSVLPSTASHPWTAPQVIAVWWLDYRKLRLFPESQDLSGDIAPSKPHLCLSLLGSLLFHQVAVWPGTSQLTSLNYHILIREMGDNQLSRDKVL